MLGAGPDQRQPAERPGMPSRRRRGGDRMPILSACRRAKADRASTTGHGGTGPKVRPSRARRCAPRWICFAGVNRGAESLSPTARLGVARRFVIAACSGRTLQGCITDTSGRAGERHWGGCNMRMARRAQSWDWMRTSPSAGRHHLRRVFRPAVGATARTPTVRTCLRASGVISPTTDAEPLEENTGS